ncbi:hypothetical protein Rcae01_06803 [Novipirellula caenicola]|uniref:Uncharacterized protein n=1 Tax=Novipirellula caenicola TaxID=1536901 RepID=A0ABP9W3A5_9BACT
MILSTTFMIAGNRPMHPSGEVGRFDNGQSLVAAG